MKSSCKYCRGGKNARNFILFINTFVINQLKSRILIWGIINNNIIFMDISENY